MKLFTFICYKIKNSKEPLNKSLSKKANKNIKNKKSTLIKNLCFLGLF